MAQRRPGWRGCLAQTALHFATISREQGSLSVGTCPLETGWCFWRAVGSATTQRVATEDSLLDR